MDPTKGLPRRRLRRRLFELIQKSDLCGIDDFAGVGEGEPAAFVHLRKGLLFPRAAGPFDFESIADDGRRVEVAGSCPGIYAFAALLPDGAEGLEGSAEADARLFAELTQPS